ncbi:hypothetical protein B0O99DRAFT_683072 [Bisporella sp. PMI_857]|nr:hypothetical protein B0O99DRAFT_683072 [Bisporella sp. PMI_857]
MAQRTTLTWINENPEILIQDKNPTHLSDLNYRPRKPHTKSRNACKNCKQRRIKCDEERPHCGQCLHRRVPCDIPTLEPTNFKSPPSRVPAPINDNESELLDHFTGASIEWIGSPECQRLMQKHARQLVLNAAYIRHAILSFSASHLASLHASQKKYAVAATFHYQRSLSLYSSYLRTSFNVADVNEIIGCSHLLMMLAFGTLCLGDSSDGFTWLRAMRGVPALWSTENLRAHMRNSIWHTVCNEAHGDAHEVFCSHTESNGEGSQISKSCAALKNLCNAQGGLATGAYQGPLQSLCQLMNLDNGRNKIGRYIFFIGSLPQSFLQLLERNDSKAVLIICYWCALFSQIDQWWITRSALVECQRLCTYLDTTFDPQIHDLLQFPASKCGYVTRNDTNIVRPMQDPASGLVSGGAEALAIEGDLVRAADFEARETERSRGTRACSNLI